MRVHQCHENIFSRSTNTGRNIAMIYSKLTENSVAAINVDPIFLYP